MKIKAWIPLESKLERVFGVPQIFTKIVGSNIAILVVKVTHDVLVAGRKEYFEVYMN